MLVWFTITCILLWRHGSAISYKEKKFSSTLTSNCCICQQYENTNQPTNQIKDDQKKKERYPWGRTSAGHSTRGQLGDLSSVDWITPPEVALEIQETDSLLDQTLDRNLGAFVLTSAGISLPSPAAQESCWVSLQRIPPILSNCSSSSSSIFDVWICGLPLARILWGQFRKNPLPLMSPLSNSPPTGTLSLLTGHTSPAASAAFALEPNLSLLL